MNPRPPRGWFSRATAAMVSAALVVSAFAPGTAALAADVTAVPVETPVGGAGSAFAGASAGAPLGAGVLAVPALSPLAAAPLPDLGGHARPVAAVPTPAIVPAAATAIAPAAAPEGRAGALARLAGWVSAAAGAGSGRAAPERAAAPSDETAGAAKGRADAEFRKLTGEAAGPERADLGEAAVPGAQSSPAPALVPAGRYAGLPAAEARARAGLKGRAAHLRLLRAAVDLRGAKPAWTFTYQDPARGKVLAATPKGVEARGGARGARPAMISQADLPAARIDAALAAVKAAEPGFRPVRAEVLPRATGGLVVVFADAKGRTVKAPAAAAPAEVPAPAAVPAPPAETPAPPAAPSAAQAPKPAAAVPEKHIREDFLGFRKVVGVVRDPKLGRLPADADAGRIIDQIAGQFGIARSEVLEMGRGFRLDETSPRADWLAVYDRLQGANLNHFKSLDAKKYSGWKTFRELANKTYPAGWRGAALRALELHKHFVGFAVRFPYHLFDQFIFGYFRQAIAFEFFHSGEDFLSLAKDKDGKLQKDLGRKWLEAAMREWSLAGGTGTLGTLRAKAWFRQAERWVVRPLAKPLATFMVRRLTLAVMSAVAMGVLGAFAPVLPMSFALTAIPYLGPAIVVVLNGLPVGVAAVPLVGHVLAPVVAAAVGALAKDLVLGPMLNTFILSTLLTFPAAAGRRLGEARDRHPASPLSAREAFAAVAGAAVSKDFWGSNLKSFAGLATVGAEIEGIMTYAGAIDGAIDPGFQALTGRKLGLFHAIGSAVERPQGQSVIPFGGAITWGSALLYKLQDATGFHVSDYAMAATTGLAQLAGIPLKVPPPGTSAPGLVGASSSRAGAKAALPFDPDLWKKSPGEVSARLRELAGQAGGLEAELSAVQAREAALDARLRGARERLTDLQRRSRPVTPEETAREKELEARLTSKRDEAYIQSKLSEKAGLQKPQAETAEELRRLRELQDKYGKMLPPPPNGRAGWWDELAAREASYKALAARLSGGPGEGGASGGDGSRLDAETLKRIKDLLDQIERGRSDVAGEMAQRDATQNLLRAANQIRNHALHERRDGQDMRRFHTDFAKLATVMDLALSLNEIAAAQSAIKQMMDLLEQKRAAILASQQQNQQSLQASQGDQAQVAQWKADAQKAVGQDKSSISDMTDLEGEASMAAARTTQFQQQVAAFIAAVDAADKGSSSDALTQYQKNLDKIAVVAQWRTSGNPNDASQFSLKEFQDDLAQVNSYLSQAQSGLNQMATMPVEYAGILVAEVPGPQVSVSNPTPQQMLQILSDRRAYWSQKLSTYQDKLNRVNQLMDPNHVLVDEFGLPHGYNQSLQNLSTLHAGDPAHGSKADAVADLAQLDRIAAELNATAGASIPTLSGLSLADLQTAIKTYGDKLKAVKFPAGTDTPTTHKAKMDLILAAQLTPMAARAIINWSVDQATIDAFDKAKAPGGALTVAQAGLAGVVSMIGAVLSDVDQDVAFVNSGSGGGQALIDRKTALLKGKVVPALTQAQGMMNTLIAYQQDSISQMQSNPNGQYYTLFDSEKTLLTQTNDLYNKTLPWALASFGGSPSDAAGSLASIAAWKASLQKYIDGYDDATGHHEGIAEYQKDMVDRQCAAGCTRTETLYGETQPYSLPQKISQYGGEKASRAAEINSQDATINEILGKIETMTNGKYGLKAHLLPTGIGTDAASVAKIQALVDANAIPNLGDLLKKIGDDAQAAGTGGGVNISAGGNGTVPSGNQPPITISNNQQIALLALDAGKRLVPSSLAQPQSAPEAYAVARYLYSDAVVSAATDGLSNQIPKAVAFLKDASAALGSAIAQTSQDVAFVNSNGTSEGADALYARKAAMFQSLDAFLKEGISFYGLKQTWDQSSLGTIDRVSTYYNSLGTIYTKGGTVNGEEIVAVNTMESALKTTYDHLDQTRQKVTSWMSQLNPKEQSALNRVASDVSQIQDKTRAVLEANIRWHDLEDQLKRSREIISAGVAGVDADQAELARLLEDPQVREAGLPADVLARVRALRLARGSWQMGGAGDPTQALVVKKSEFPAFLDAMLGMLMQGSQQLAHQDVSAIKGDLLKNPQGLAAFIPGSSVVDFGDTADGFYLVYQSRFSVPNGLETGSWVTLGNVAQLWGNNVSVNGYAFSSPPSPQGQNAPYGDKGVEVQVESLQGENWVNYLNVDLHRFAFDIPSDNTFASNAGESRLMVFDDYAMMLLDGRLYVGLAGYGDMALDGPGQHPYYYGGNAKTSLKLTEVMSLDAEQQRVFAKDPRKFLQDVNLDFTGYDPSLNQNFAIAAAGANKDYSRTQVGPHFDLNRLMHPDGGGDTFTLDLFYAKTSGTDDINQQSVGATVLKGFSLKNDDGKTWLRVDNRLTGEAGQKADTLGDRLTFTLPDSGISLSGEGRLVGTKSSHYAELSKKVGDNTAISLGYGSQYIGQNDRLSLALNTSFTLAQLWQSVADNSAKTLQGGETLAPFNQGLSELFSPEAAKSSRQIAELQRIYEADVARKLISQDIGALTRDISDLRKAGAFMDNTRVRGMVGFTSNPVSNDLAERAVGGGFTVGTYSEMTLTKTQKKLVEDKAESLYREGLRLQDRLIELTREWQGAVVDVAQAQWDLRLARFEVESAATPILQAEAQARLDAARDRLHQALIRYNSLTGRDPEAGSPFEGLDAADLQALIANIGALLRAPDRYKQILAQLSPDELKARLGPDPFNAMDWLPWIDKLSIGFGVQYQDMLANQVLTLGASVRLPIYDPGKKGADHAYELETDATRQSIAQVWRERSLRAEKEAAAAQAWAASARSVVDESPRAAERLSEAIRKYRNGLIGPAELRADLDAWRFYAHEALATQAQAALSSAEADLDRALVPKDPRPSDPLRVSSLGQAFEIASRNSHGLAEVADRADAAEATARAQDHRVQKFWLDLGVGTGLTARGLGWLPSIGVTGIPVTPIFGFELKPAELRELEVSEHENQRGYYEALKSRLEIQLAVEFYQNAVALRSAEVRLQQYDAAVLPRLEEAARGGDAAAVQALGEARLGRARAELERAQARQTLNFLLGRDEKAEISVDMDERTALEQLSALLKAKDPVNVQKEILERRVDVAHAVEDIVDKDLKVDVLQLEPVSLVVRSLGRLIGALSDKPIYNADNAAAARLEVLEAERARDAYDARRAQESASIRLQLSRARDELRTYQGKTDPESALKQNELAAAIFSYEAGLLARGEDPDAGGPARSAEPPRSWAELTRRLADAEQSLVPREGAAAPATIAPETALPRSSANARYYYAKQTLGHEPIDRGYVEGWIELRLKDPSTPPEVLLELSRLREKKAGRLYRDSLVRASARADILAAEFAGDVRLLRWADAELRKAGGNPDLAAARQPNAAAGSLAGFRADLARRLGGARDRVVALLGLPPATTLESLTALVPDDAAAGADLPKLAEDLIADIRARSLDSVRSTLFEGGLPASLGSEDNLMSQIRANTIAERMSYKGFTPVAAAGVFRGQRVLGGFLEAPDPRDIERALESVMSDVLRKQLESDGRLKELSLRLHELMAQVDDGARELESARARIEAAEADLKARAELEVRSRRADGSGDPAALAELAAAQKRLVDAWSDFSKTMVDTKSAFVSLVTELEALGADASDGLHPASGPSLDEPRAPRDTRGALLDFTAEREADAGFESRLDAKLAQAGAAVGPEARARLRAAAESYRQALSDAAAARSRAMDEASRTALLASVDVEGHRLAVRAAAAQALRGLGALDPRASASASDLVAFFRGEADAAAREGAADRGAKLALTRELGEAFWQATKPAPEAEAALRDLRELDEKLDAAREDLLASYLADAGDRPGRFITQDDKLDAYLKAQDAYDRELAVVAASPVFRGDASAARVLDALHDVRESLARRADAVKYGRGMAALDALLMLEESRLRAAQWARRPPSETDAIFASLRDLRELKARWTDPAGKDRGAELQPLYAVARVENGRTTWSIDGWLGEDELRRALADPKAPKLAAREGLVVREENGRFFVDSWPNHPGRHELVGGVDVAEALRADAGRRIVDDDAQAGLEGALLARGPGGEYVNDFVAVGADGRTAGLAFDQVFGEHAKDQPQSLYEQGRVYFFEAPKAGPDGAAAEQKSLSPLEALSRRPEDVVTMIYDGDPALARDRFESLQSLRDSEAAAKFRRLVVSPSGAEKLRARAQDDRALQLRRGWIEVALNSFGFARDASGRMTQLYRTADDYSAQAKAFANAEADRDAAVETRKAAKAEVERREREARQAEVDLMSESAALKSRGVPPSAGGKAMDRTLAARQKAADRLREARARLANAETAVKDAERTVERSKSWTLYRTDALRLSLDAEGRLVRVEAPFDHVDVKDRREAPIDESVGGAQDGASVQTLTGPLSAAIVDAQGRLVKRFATEEEVDAAAPAWTLSSYAMDGALVSARADGVVSPKVRLSHFEAEVAPGRRLPVLLSERYLIDRLDASRSRLQMSQRWAIMPYNWGNIVLEIPRGIAGAPVELLTGRDPRQEHYLGRAAMYKTEGGETEHHGFFRRALGWIDVLNLLPDPVSRAFDPSQLPDAVRPDSPLKPGEILAQKSPVDPANGKDVHFGALAMARQTREAAEDLDAARERTLSRFNGGVEDVTLATLRGRGRWDPQTRAWTGEPYLQSSVRVLSGDEDVAGRRVPAALARLGKDAALRADPASDGRSADGATVSATPDGLFVDRVTRRTFVYPGAAGYAREAAALDGYGGRAAAAAQARREARPALDAALKSAAAKVSDRDAARRRAQTDEDRAWSEWHALAERIGLQKELERRMDALRAEIRDLEAERAGWARYVDLLNEALRGDLPGQPGRPGRPAPNPMFWVWAFVLFGLGALLAALWNAWRAGAWRRVLP